MQEDSEVEEHFDDQEEDDQSLVERYQVTTDKGQEALRIDKFLMNRMLNVSRNKIQNAAKAECILVNGQAVKPNYKVRPNDNIVVLFPKPQHDSELIAEDIPLNIVYEDDFLLVVNKEPGMVVHPGTGNFTGTLVNALAYKFKDLPTQNANDRPGLVHRIDKNTSGLLVIAKTEYAMTYLAKQFFDHSIERKYLALVWGDFDEDEGTIEGHIGRHQRYRKKMDVYPEGEYGKEAITHYKVIERLGYVTLIECQLETGRTHQIRVHMEYTNHPLFNDETYGGNRIVKGTVFSKYKQFIDNCFSIMPRHALHAKSLGFKHPESEEWLSLESKLPEDFQAVLEKWRRYINGLTNQG